MASTVGVLGDQPHHDRDRVARLAAGAVDRVVAAPTRRQLGVDRGAAGRRAARPTARSRSLVMASAVTTPHPPAVVSTTTLGPLGSGCVANVAAASNASSTDRRPGDPVRPAGAVEHLVVGGQRAGVAGGGARAACGGAALQQHQRLACGRTGRGVASGRRRRRSPRCTPARPRSPGRRRRTRGSRRRVTAAALPADTARLTPTPVERARLRKLDTKLPDWLATPIRAGRRIGRHDLGAQLGRCRHHALPVRVRRAGSRARRPSATSSRSARAPGLARLAVPGRGQERRPDPFARARPQRSRGWPQPACTRTRGRSRRRAARRCRRPCCTPSTSSPARLVANTPPS